MNREVPRDLPFFLGPEHAALAEKVSAFREECLATEADESDVNTRGREIALALGKSGLLRYVVPEAYGGAWRQVDVRALCVIREGLAYASGLADSMFALQGLGSYPITLSGTESQKQRWLPRVAEGTAIAAFALTEPNAGSDVSSMESRAERRADRWTITGRKTFITNAGIADVYSVFALTQPDLGSKGMSAFVLPSDAKGLVVERSIELLAPHPMGEVRFDACEATSEHLLGWEGQGFKTAMSTLDVFRPTVGAAALGFARRALDEAVLYATRRVQFGKPLAAMQSTQFALAEMATALEAARLLVYRAAWEKDHGAGRVTSASSMAKLAATEIAQRVVDRALQIHGAAGLVKGHPMERLYRDVRALRIYEGTSEIQKVIIARDLLKPEKP